MFSEYGPRGELTFAHRYHGASLASDFVPPTTRYYTQWNYGFMGFKLRSIRIHRQTRLFARFYDFASQKACFHGIDR